MQQGAKINPDEFCRWLQGFAELTEGVPSDNQWKSIKEHLQKVFEKITPPVEPSKVDKPIQDLINEAMKKIDNGDKKPDNKWKDYFYPQLPLSPSLETPKYKLPDNVTYC